MPPPTVFISYSHKDEIWKDRLRPHLRMLEQDGRLVIWDDRDIDAGATWYNEIKNAMEHAADVGFKGVLRKASLLTRDPREKERKKPGLKKARKAKQYTKR
jgi:hypothetical protein